MKSFKNDIQRSFPYLFEKWGFEFANLENDYGGNVVVAQSDNLKIRFVHDRADFFINIGRVGEPDEWIGFYEIIDQLRAQGMVNTEYSYSNKIRAVSRLLEQYFPEIQSLFEGS